MGAGITNGIIPSGGGGAYRGALVSKTGAQTLTTAVSTALVFQAEDYDTDAIHDNSVNNTRLTVPAGVTRVRLSCSVEFGPHGTGVRQLLFKKDAGFVPGIPVVSLPTSPVSQIHYQGALSAALTVVGGEYFELFAMQTSGGDLAVAAADFTWFSMEIIE